METDTLIETIKTYYWIDKIITGFVIFFALCAWSWIRNLMNRDNRSYHAQRPYESKANNNDLRREEEAQEEATRLERERKE